ncbi:MAG: HAMP domain-containing protein [Candidatus Aminicenantes bacterium]|nr:HAMP domain-containing protein [Candidatus Aminicenantes bacterium]
MNRSLFLKIFGVYFLIIVLLTVLVLFVSFVAFRKYHMNSLAQNLEHLGEAIKFQIVPFLEKEEYEKLDAFVKSMKPRIKTRITVVDRDGKVLADSDEDPAVMDDHQFRPEILRAWAGEVGRANRFSRTIQKNMLYVGIPMTKSGEVTAVLRLSLYRSEINLFLSRMRKNMIQVVLVITLAALIISFFFARSLARPIRELSNASKRIAEGDFDTKVFIKNRDELQELMTSFNYMTDQIKSLFDEISRKKDELNSILSSIREGLLAIDKEGKILISNDSFDKIAGHDKIREKYYWEVLREPEFGDLIKGVRESGKNRSAEIGINDRIYFCSAIYLGSRGEIVVTFHDMTEVKNIEKIKKDFIVNVSHELRTPLTAIKGFVETLKEDIGDKGSEYLQIINRHTERLINIVKDLLFLSELEEKKITLEWENVDFGLLTENIMKIFRPKIKDKNLDLEVSVTKNLPPLVGDSFKLEQMLINLVDNAVKYTEKGKITVSLKQDKDCLILSVEDTGIGIPDDQQNRIFERFYVVDKSRSRKGGGTGLGLSIVKHITLLHRGEVKVESGIKGSRFTVSLPLNP